jgi:CspA family cold shock protein
MDDDNQTTGTGRIKHILSDKGFGFVRSDSEQKEYFFHRTGVVGISFSELREGDRITFDIVPSPKGPRAENVQRA